MADVSFAGRSMDEEQDRATRATLLERLREVGDDESWREFFDQYWKLIYNAARRSGLDDAEAQDVVQETLLTVVRHMKNFRYDPARGSFKSWLLTLTRGRVVDHVRKVARRSPMDQALGSGMGEAVEDVADPTIILPDAQWDAEWRANQIATAMTRVQAQVSAKQFQIFHCYVIEKWTVRETCRALGVSAGQVYVAKHRISRLFKTTLAELEREEATP